MAKKKKEKGNWVSRLKAGAKYITSGKAMQEKLKQEAREKRLKEINDKLAKKKGKKKKGDINKTLATKRIERHTGLEERDLKKVRGNYSTKKKKRK